MKGAGKTPAAAVAAPAFKKSRLSNLLIVTPLPSETCAASRGNQKKAHWPLPPVSGLLCLDRLRHLCPQPKNSTLSRTRFRALPHFSPTVTQYPGQLDSRIHQSANWSPRDLNRSGQGNACPAERLSEKSWTGLLCWSGCALPDFSLQQTVRLH
jgi:hypothetical protein